MTSTDALYPVEYHREEFLISRLRRKAFTLCPGNVIQGDESVCVHVIKALVQQPHLQDVECLYNGTRGFILQESLKSTEKIFLIDAAANGYPIGPVIRTTLLFTRNYPSTLTTHDISARYLLDAFYMQSDHREVIQYAITIDPNQSISMKLSEKCT